MKAYLFCYSKIFYFFLIFSLCQFPIKLFSQVTSLSQYVLLAGNGGSGTTSPGSLGYGIVLNAGTSVNGGFLGANSMIKTTGASNINASIFSKGQVVLANSTTVSGKITAANIGGLTGNILSTGTSMQLLGNIDINGNINIGGGNVAGTVTHPAGTSYTGPNPGANIIGSPTLPVLPDFPSITSFPAAGATNITNTQVLSPGSYGNLTLSGNKTITFNGPGVYVFNSMNLSMKNNFIYNFQNNPTGLFKIYIHGNMNLDKITTSFINGGSASKIFIECHGLGLTSPSGKDAVLIANGPAATAGLYAKFHGTIWAPYAAVSIGSSSGGRDFIGSIYSGTQIYLQSNVNMSFATFSDCSLLTANAGIDTSIDCINTSVQLNGVSNALTAQYLWSTSNGSLGSDSNTATPIINQFGTYVLKVTDPFTNCIARDTVIVTFISCILPGYVPPTGGKQESIIGPDLTSLGGNYNNANPNEDIFVLKDDSVWIEIIYREGKYASLYSLLTSPPFNLTEFVDNGVGNRIITTLIRVSELDELNNLNITANDSLINFVRPLYRPIVSVGIANTAGDIAQRSNLSRGGFNVNGEGIKIGVLSNSYNTQPGNQALIDVNNGDLPGIGNPNGNLLPVQVQDYTKGVQSDEGRAMLQIIHDIAPKAELAFRTGFISAGNMAAAIKQLQQDGCHIEVDDITYLTEPYFHDGMIAKAVNEVKDLGVAYFTAAGNFGDRSYEGIFNPTATPGSLTGTAHDFGGGDRFQSISLTPGSYLVALQWEDGFYSIDQNQTGTQNDLDIYLTTNNGNTLFGFNRNNIGGDPIEILPFTVTANTTTNILITRASGSSSNVHFKYIFFKGAPTINEFNIGTSTIVGQANALGAITTGAVSYTNTPVYGVPSPTKASFSSTGGTLMSGMPRLKPDFCAPNGGNTTVDLGGLDIENDLLPNFFGTSASAPHAAAAAALVLEAKMVYDGLGMTPDQLKSNLINSALDMHTPGFDYLSGYGLLDAYSAIKSFAQPKPLITSLEVPTTIIPGNVQFTVTVHGNYLTTNSKVIFGSDTLPTTFVNDQQLTATVSAFSGNPALKVCTPAMSLLANDGGCSSPLFFQSIVKKDVVITTQNKTKRYGEILPEFTDSISVDGIPLQQTNYTLADLGLDSISHNTPANQLSNVGNYFIQSTAMINDSSLLQQFDYTFNNGILFVTKMPLVIKPSNKVVYFGDKISGSDFDFDYTFDQTNLTSIAQAALLDTLQQSYKSNLLDVVALIDDRDTYEVTVSDGMGGTFSTHLQLGPNDLQNLSFLSGSRGIANGSRGIVNGSRGIANNHPPDTTRVIDLFVGTLFGYNTNSTEVDFDSNLLLMNGSRGIANGSRGIVNSEALVNGTALVNGSRGIANGSRGIANGSRGIANGEAVDSVSNNNIAVIVHELDLDAVEDTSVSFELFSLCGITGLTAGEHYIIPGAFPSSNFSVTYELGNLTILPYPLDIVAHDTFTTYGTDPVYTSEIIGFQYDDSIHTVLSGQLNLSVNGTAPLDADEYIITPSGYFLQEGVSNYIINYISGNLVVEPADLEVIVTDQVKKYGFEMPELTFNYYGFKYDDDESDLSILPTISCGATFSSYSGIYPIEACCGLADNYNFIYHNGNLNIQEAPSCSIIPPYYIPFCGSVENMLTAIAPVSHNYEWNFYGTGTNFSNQNEIDLYYNVDQQGISGDFVFNVFAPITNWQVASCSLNLVNNCLQEYCTYTQEEWSDSTQTNCIGDTLVRLVPSLLSWPLSVGAGNHVITYNEADSSCLISKLPSGNINAPLPLGLVTCDNATGIEYQISPTNEKYKNNLLGQTIALSLSIRSNPNLGDLEISDEYLATYPATACINGLPASEYSSYFHIPISVLNQLYFYEYNTVNGLLYLANNALGNSIQPGGPTHAEIAEAIESVLDGFHNCRILDGFYSGVPSRLADTSIKNNMDELNQLSIYPNPSSDFATISFSTQKGKTIHVELYNVSGKLISTLYHDEGEDGTRKIDINCSQYANGVYFVRLKNGDELNVKKLVIIGH